MSAAMYMRELRLNKKDNATANEFYKACVGVFYVIYDMDAPPEDSLKAGIEYLEKTFRGFKVKM